MIFLTTGFPTQEQVNRIRTRYPVGTRIVLHSMDDPYAKIPAGTKGTVECVDDAGQIHVAWDTGASLALIPGEDLFSVDSTAEKEQKRTKSRRGGESR